MTICGAKTYDHTGLLICDWFDVTTFAYKLSVGLNMVDEKGWLPAGK